MILPKAEDIFEVAKQLTKLGFAFKLEFPAGYILVAGDYERVKEALNCQVWLTKFSNFVKVEVVK